MTQSPDTKALLDAAKQIMTAAGCASLITVDESGLPSSRAVRTFLSDDKFTKIVIPTHPDSRKTVQVRNNSNVVLSYIDVPSRGYVTVIGKAVLNDRLEDRRTFWSEPFLAFFPGGPESEEYLLMDFTPERLELRSFILGVAEEPTRWSPATLERAATGAWQQTS
jgi:general stress protein 26